MKKIIATVLAMVMALALCATAFAAETKYTAAYNNKGEKVSADNDTYTVVSDVAKKADATKKTDAQVKGYHVNEIKDKSGNFVYYLAATAADYDLKLTVSGRTDLYLKEAPNSVLTYKYKVTAFTAIGEKCGQLDVDPDGTYYSYTDAKGNTSYFETAESGINVLFKNELVSVSPIVGAELNDHDWKAATYNKDGTVATYKCAECGTVATVYKTADAAKAAGAATVEVLDNGDIIGYTYTAGTTTTTTDKNSSPKTFDAGIAMYVGMALTSVAGSAVVIGKKKEF